jgi:glycosyltransferase involved in cell wall biosynthesis
MLKVLYTHRTQGKGAEGAHVAGMVEAFRLRGHQVVVDCLPGCDPTQASAAPAPGAVGAPARKRWLSVLAERAPQWLFGVLEVLYNLPLAARLLPRLLRDRPDFVYERYSLCTFAPVLLCRLLRIPHVLEVNDSVVIERSRPLKLVRTAAFIERWVLARTQLGITISERFLAQLKAGVKFQLPRMIVCPNAVSEVRFLRRARLSAQARQELRARYRLGSGPVIGSAGQFVAWHGLPAFVDAAAALIRQHRIELLFVGDGPTREDTLAAARRHGLQDQLRFTGMLGHDAVPDHLELLDVAIIPYSNLHGSPMKLMEFMAMGLPVVAPALPPVLEVVRDGETAFLFAPDDMQAMSQVLQACLADPEQARQVGQAAREHVAAHLTWDVHAQQVLRCLGLDAKEAQP